MSKYLSAAEDIVLTRCDFCHRKRIQRIGITDYCELHLLMELLELQGATGMKLVKVAIGGDGNPHDSNNLRRKEAKDELMRD